jgi:hypothetical protein
MTGKRFALIIPANPKNPYIVKKSGRRIVLVSKVQPLHLPRPAA